MHMLCVGLQQCSNLVALEVVLVIASLVPHEAAALVTVVAQLNQNAGPLVASRGHHLVQWIQQLEHRLHGLFQSLCVSVDCSQVALNTLDRWESARVRLSATKQQLLNNQLIPCLHLLGVNLQQCSSPMALQIVLVPTSSALPEAAALLGVVALFLQRLVAHFKK